MDRPDDILLHYLMGFLTPERKQRFESVISRRTRYITIVLENIYQSQNASAVLRTSECCGVQDLHIIENEHPYSINPDVVIGSDKWLTLHCYNDGDHNTTDCINRLRGKGYRIIATSPHITSRNVEDIPLDNKLAIMFGTELTGLSDEAMNLADGFLSIPMVGFTESFNISVSAAIVIYHLTSRLRKENVAWQLSDEERTSLLLDWTRKSVRMSELLEKNFWEKIYPDSASFRKD